MSTLPILVGDTVAIGLNGPLFTVNKINLKNDTADCNEYMRPNNKFIIPLRWLMIVDTPWQI